ncbi:MAG: D-alanyl-D-alanine carboxypeptidase [Lachnospiraceae bacterium]|nr:D-alanyl-D-alanine carboxypeptidase [Lachnospiraceae bacterium]
MNRRLNLVLAILLSGMLIFTRPLPALADDIGRVNETIDAIPSNWPAAPNISAGSAILIDADSRQILYAKHATVPMYPASTTKLMTALLTLERSGLTDIVDFPFSAVNIPSGSSHIGMRRGEKMVLRECLYGLLLPSANEVANALAEHVSGSQTAFVGLMNERAYRMGCVNTHFVNANGLHDENHYTCAYDLALIMQACIQSDTFVTISSSLSYVHHADELLNKDIPMTNTNMMIRSTSEYYNSAVICGKTGHTDEAGYNLVTYAEKDGTRLIAVVMGCENGGHFASTQSLLDYGFNYFHQVLPAELDTSLNMESSFTSSPLKIPAADISLLKIRSTDTILLPDTISFDMLDRRSVVTDDEVLIVYTYQDYPLGSVTLVSSDDTASSPLFREQVQEKLVFESNPPLVVIDGWLLAALTGSVALFLFLRFLFGLWFLPKRHRSGIRGIRR